MASAQDLTAVLFDFDGTLYDLQVDFGDFLQRWSPAGGTVTRILETLANADLAEALKEIDALEMAGVRRGGPLPGAADMLKRVAAHHPVAVVSRNSLAAVRAGLAVMGASEMMVIGRESVRLQKPAAEPVVLALERLWARTGVLVGDSLHDVQAASAAGIVSIVVPNPKLAFRPEKADYYVDSIRDIPRLIEDMAWTKRA